MTAMATFRLTRPRWFAGVLLVAGLAGPARAEAPQAALSFEQATFDAGDVYQHAVLEHAFSFTNTADHAVRITGVQAGDPAAKVEPQTGRFAPGKGGVVRVRQPLGPRLGEVTFRFTVLTDDVARPGQELVLTAFAQSAYDSELPFLDFGDVDRSLGETLTLELASRETDAVHLVQVVSAPDFVDVSPGPRTGVAGENLEVRIAVKPQAPSGVQNGVVHLRTDIAHHPDYLVRFRAGIFGDVVPARIPLELGVLRVGEAFSARLQLGSRTARPFRVEAVRDALGWLEADAQPCGGGPAPADCWVVSVRQTPVRPGQVRGTLEARIDGEWLPLTYNGLVAAADATIHDLGEIGNGPTRRDVPGDGGGRP